jgi:signal transduction histidine kinase
MYKYPPKPKEQLDLLKNLLNAEQEERKEIARIFHQKKNDLLMTGFPLLELQKNQVNEKAFQEVKSIIDAFHKDSGNISKAIFPAIVDTSGIIRGLRQFCIDIKAIYSEAEVEILTTDVAFDNLDKQKEFNTYKICTEIIKYFCDQKYYQVKVVIYCDLKKNLEIEVEGIKSVKNAMTETERKKKLKLIQGRLVQQNAKVFPETNWDNLFRFQIGEK